MESFNTQSFNKGYDILYNRYEDVDAENEAIAQYIEDIIGVKFKENSEEEFRGLAFSDIAILLRTWNKASSIVQALERHNIPYITAGVNQLFEMEEVQAALGIFNYLYGDIDSDELKEKWLNIPHAKSFSGENRSCNIKTLREKSKYRKSKR